MYIKIGQVSLEIMRYKVFNGKVIQKPSKGNKRGMWQEAPVDLEDFNYDIPKMSYAEDLLKETIKILNCKNDKINFFSFHFSQT